MSQGVAPATAGEARGPVAARALLRAGALRRRLSPAKVLALGLVLALAALLRLWRLDAVGFNSDEAVYAGTAAAIAGDPPLAALFPVFRAHPILFQSLLALLFHHGVSDWAARALAAGIGVAAVGMTHALGQRLYGFRAGLLAALLLAVMPYHVVISRQVLLDGLMCLCATAALYCVVRYAESIALPWALATGGAAGLAILTKETAVILLGGLYAFVALTPMVWLRLRHIWLSLATTAGLVAVYPLVLVASRHVSTGGNYLLWQLFRRPNHELLFYVKVVPAAVGLGVIAAAAAGLVWLRREYTWRERLLLCWLAAPVAFFTVWPVKGYQYLLPIAPVLAVLAGRTVARMIEAASQRGWRAQPAGRRPVTTRTQLLAALVALGLAASLAIPAWQRIDPSPRPTFLAGTGGLPGGRSAGGWVAANVPVGAQLLTIGPSMANVLQFYGHRRAFALSVSPNALSRNPSYVAVTNPDRALRDGVFAYVVWDSFTADRSPFFAERLLKLVDKYHGVARFTATVLVASPSGQPTPAPTIIVYQVRST